FAALPLASLSSALPLPATTFTPTTTNVAATTSTNPVIATVNTTMPAFPVLTLPASSGVTPPLTTTSLAAAQHAQATDTIGGAASFVFPQVVTGGEWSSQI